MVRLSTHPPTHPPTQWGDYTGLGSEAESQFTDTGALWMLGYTKADNEKMVERLSKFGVGSEVGARTIHPTIYDQHPYSSHHR